MNVPESLSLELGKALIQSDSERFIELVELNKINSNSLLDEQEQQTLLHQAIQPLSELHGSQNQIDIVDYLLKNGADVNVKNRDGFSPLHVALEYHSLSRIALILITKGNPEIDSYEKNGNNLVFTAIREYGKTWREEQKEVNRLRLEIIEELLSRGANLDQKNNHGISSRRWLDVYDDEKLNELVKKFE